MIRERNRPTYEPMISEALRSLDDDLRHLLIMHNGYGDTPGMPFEEMAHRLDRPIQDLIEDEKAAIRRLRRPQVAQLMVEIIRMADDMIWQSLENQDGVVYKKGLKQHTENRLSGELLICIKCLYENVRNWLNHHAEKNRIAWYRSEYPKNVINGVIKQFHELEGRTRFPMPYQRIAEQMKTENRLLSLSLALSKNKFEIYRGYVCALPFGSRALRAVRLHLMFFYRYSEEFLPIEKIHTEYLDSYSDDNATARDVIFAMTDHPHMFLKIGNLYWCSIMSEAGSDPYRQKKISAKLEQPDKDKAQFFFKRPRFELSIPELIKETLKNLGMARPGEIEAHVKKKYKNRVEEGANLIPLISGSPDLLQIAPTVYALRENDGNPDPQIVQNEKLLTRSDVRWYVISRYAGEPMNLFFLWTSEMEKKWCSWAQKRATNPAKSRLFQSLMYVADPNNWLADEDEKKYWLEVKKWNGCYYLRHDCKHRIWLKIPPLRDLLILSMCTCKMGGMNWIRVNSMAGYYLFDQHSITHLALLIALRVLKPTDHWQNPHQIGPSADVIRKKLLDVFQIDARSTWDSEVGLELRSQLSTINEKQDLGWINIKDLVLLSKKLAGESVASAMLDAEDANPTPDIMSKQLELPFK